MKSPFKVSVILVLFMIAGRMSGQETSNPGNVWQQYQNVTDAGFDSAKLMQVRDTFLSQGGDALLVIRNGNVVLSAGQVARCFRQTSVRKSYLNALYGIYYGKGVIDTGMTLSALGIDDIDRLSDSEKEATILDLLKSRSGIYHRSAYSPESMEKRLPERGSFAHGEHWYYNNWDFNALGTIFRQTTGKDIFKEFQQEIAIPLQFEDFSLRKTKYLFEPDKSEHPAYLFRMSARDMARFGLLYLNDGVWNDTRVISSEWIDMSLQAHSKNGTDKEGIHWDDYGLLWWVSTRITREPVYYASGSGVQRISIFPESDMVMVHLVDNYQPKQVNEEQVDYLTRLLLDAKTGDPAANAETMPMAVSEFEIEEVRLSGENLEKYAGSYSNPRLGKFTVKAGPNQLLLEAAIGNFILYPLNDNTFISEDIQVPMQFEQGESDSAGSFEMKMNSRRIIEYFIFYYP